MKKILMVMTSNERLENTDSTTGVWLGEFTDPFYKFLDQGYEVTLCSALGGEPPVDPRSKLTENITTSNKRFNEDQTAQEIFGRTLRLADVKAEDYDGLFFPGGHGPMFDLANDEQCGRLILDFFNVGKPIGAVCHGPAAFIKAAEMQPDFLKGKKVTAYSNKEERLVFLYDNIPFKLQDRLKELGAVYNSSTIPFTANVLQDGLLTTGQNPASAGGTAEAMIELLEKELVS